MGFLLSKLLPLGLYPLGLALVLQLVGLVGRRRRWGPWLSGGGVLLLWIAAMPYTSRQLVWGLEEPAAALTPAVIPRADAVVVLGSGLRPALAPRRQVEVNEAGDRLLTGLRLLRQGKAPVLLTSGAKVHFASGDPAPAEAEVARQLAIDLGAPAAAILTNPGSRTTAEEARDIGQLGRQRGWTRILLVTSATHMPRSLATFRRRSGLEVIPVACDFQLTSRNNYGGPTAASVMLDLAPDAGALLLTSQSLKEHLGLLVYRLKGWS
ncbi:YdcF family protein [Synechococcus sp. CBW1002]|uniref:YdcF family protein n=1 Tax=Synechococcus sp. CBW1002 TaxID=1353134 RepID=UPI0018CD692D|nr:YdcF family protein [Synechococcus sp. CBW1002]QPN60934.1 YdcF family protein [Synechococcus sp. CBW1002]